MEFNSAFKGLNNLHIKYKISNLIITAQFAYENQG